MVVRRVGPLSCAKIAGTMYAIIGLLIGLVVSMASMVIGTSAGDEMPNMAMFGALFGIGAVVLMPIFYGALGFVTALISAFIYNALAGFVGGVEIEVDTAERPVAVQA